MFTLLMLTGMLAQGASASGVGQSQNGSDSSPSPSPAPSPALPASSGNSTAVATTPAVSHHAHATTPHHANATAPHLHAEIPFAATGLNTTTAGVASEVHPATNMSTALTTTGSRSVALSEPLSESPSLAENRTVTDLAIRAPTPEPALEEAEAPATPTPAPTPTPREEPPPTIVGKTGEVIAGDERARARLASGNSAKVNAVHSTAINNLLRTTETGGGVLSEIDELGLKPTIVRQDLGRGTAGEAALSDSRMIKLNSRHDLRKNAITAAHEFRHREQFAHGVLDKSSNPYRKAAAEIEAKITGVKTYQELHEKGYFEDDPTDVDNDRLDHRDYVADPQAYKRQVFKMYLARYRGAEIEKHPDFESDAALDAHIAHQENHFATRRHLAKVEAEIHKKGYHPDNISSLPAELKERLQAARAENRVARRAVKRSEPSRRRRG